MKVAVLQMNVRLGDVEANRQKALHMIHTGLAHHAQLFVLPEMWTTGYRLDQIHTLAEPETGPTLLLLQRLAREYSIEIIAGSIAESRNSKIYNTAYAIDKTGAIIAKYSKIHLIGLMAEEKYISPGDRKCSFELSTGPAGLIICYDIRFTELPRSLALEGCTTLFIPAQWPEQRGEHWRVLNQARAIENQLFVISANTVNGRGNGKMYGHSMIIDPWGKIIAEGGSTEELILADVDFSTVADIRKRLPVFTDRRPQYY
ncbi:carbon-nitrogen family hydrolase|uniref:Carbon-nitrogen hydrolase n=1 Tax=Dendrosporobacter quercicolus TaxID=146817 RepID=A0A1G9XV34_9FIRM|nr:carbon-nitrogen family hydrolase [Dendrosporobacter quercicolus]NSL49088.1 carbon-nitrogen family hydrolase [Dendrosporobacter quercicolus DSM 1736]SDN00093.1 Carbon-nitrogen hydrolase [Dendrosporobacter quercicolus]